MNTIKKIYLFILLAGCQFVNGQTYNVILGRPTDSAITMSIMFIDKQADVYWEYGTTSGNYTNTTPTFVAQVNTPLEFDFTNLLPNTKYFYRTRYRAHGTSSTFSAGTEHTFVTQRLTGSTFTFDVEADEHLYDYGNSTLYGITLNNEAKDNPDFLMTLGDIFGDDHYPWTITSHQCDSLHYLYRARLGTICHSIPFYICLGNHEGEKYYYLDSIPPNNLAVWSTLWRKYYYPNPYPNNFYTGDTIHEGYGIGQPENYYAWTWGNALFVVLDVYRNDCYNAPSIDLAKPGNWDWTLGKTEYTWLKNTLESSKSQYKFVFAHHVSGESRGGIIPAKLCEWGGYDKNGSYLFDTYRPGWGKPIHQLFVDNGVNIFFQGHDHLFAHEVLDNVTYQEVPMAADATYTKGMLANGDAYTSDTIDASGHVRVTVSPSFVKVDYIRAFLPTDTLSHVNHNGEVAFSYMIPSKTPAAIEKVTVNHPVLISPNPASDEINIVFNQPIGINKAVVVQLQSIDGRIIKQLKQNGIVDTVLNMGIQGISPGIYTVIITVDRINTSCQKLIIR